jgi:SAM-dependent methyltransferase
MGSAEEISAAFVRHYTAKVNEHGPTAAGVDWRVDANAEIAYDKMLAVIREEDRGRRPSVLDAGCGYGGLLGHARRHGLDLDYTGVDITPEMIAHGRRLYPEARFEAGDLLEWPEAPRFDYVVCSGILTLKLAASILDMNAYFGRIVRRMFALADKGIAFNCMSNRVNYMEDKLYYRSPVEVLAFCLSELSTKVRLDHAYERFEFTTYVYRDGRS